MDPIIGVAKKDVKTFFRERGTVFWTIAFPVLMLLLFTAIFGREIPFTANIGIVNDDKTTPIPIAANIISGLNETKVFNVKIFENKTEALEALNATSIRAVITIPENFAFNLTTGMPASVSLVVDETNPDTARLVRDGIRTFFAEFYREFNKNYTEPISVIEESSITQQRIGYKEYIVPGVLCYPLLFSSMVASTGAIVYERERGTLKKIRASPIRPLNMLFGKTLAALFQTTISILIIAVLAVFLLGPKVNWNIPLLVPIVFLGSMNGIAIGLLISCIGRSPQEASGAATTIGIVLQFFIGMYFPLEYLPEYLQQVGRAIPMTYAAQAVRDIMIRNAMLSDILQPMVVLIISAIILYAVGVLLYKRWVEKE
ncbi:MAG: ABC transporter permease [Candidatus Bathyarchaeia archaeon]|nr:ABC transporter permease [Candidatus Bathyarchaeia archaeon]